METTANVGSAGRLADAISEFKHVLGSGPKDTGSPSSGHSVAQCGKNERDANTELEKVVLDVPDNLEAQAGLEDPLLESGIPRKAVLHYTRVVRLSPYLADAPSQPGNGSLA